MTIPPIMSWTPLGVKNGVSHRKNTCQNFLTTTYGRRAEGSYVGGRAHVRGEVIFMARLVMLLVVDGQLLPGHALGLQCVEGVGEGRRGEGRTAAAWGARVGCEKGRVAPHGRLGV